jgi:hypothetical protein
MVGKGGRMRCCCNVFVHIHLLLLLSTHPTAFFTPTAAMPLTLVGFAAAADL